jgi:hypothetical protein
LFPTLALGPQIVFVVADEKDVYVVAKHDLRGKGTMFKCHGFRNESTRVVFPPPLPIFGAGRSAPPHIPTAFSGRDHRQNACPTTLPRCATMSTKRFGQHAHAHNATA